MKQLLCYGDSNTWGLIPGTMERFPWGVRWTSLLQEKLREHNISVLEEGLCGRTTIFDDIYRDNRNGLKTLPMILETHRPVDAAIIMLGTNDCKAHYKANAYRIAKGLEQCVDKILEEVPSENVLIISPIYLGEEVWKAEYDPEFDQNSVETSKQLYREYRKIADKKKVKIIAASDFVKPSDADQEHLDAKGHARLADVVYDTLVEHEIILQGANSHIA